MNNRKHLWIGVFAAILGMVPLGLLLVADAQTFGSTHTPDAMQAYSLSMQPDANGQFTVRSNRAAHDWRDGTVTPERQDGEIDPVTNRRIPRWPMIAEYPQVGDAPVIPFIAYYWEGSFRAYNGSRYLTPKRWAYVRQVPEVWNPLTKRMEVPGLPGTPEPTTPPMSDPNKPLPKSLRYGVDSLKIRYTTGDILRAIDESLFNEPSEGAPEEGGAAPL